MYGTPLAIITSQSDQNEIISIYNERPDYYLIGYNDISDEGSWLWVDGTNGTYTNWKTNEPNNNGNEDCAAIADSAGQWNDAPCDGLHEFICYS